MIHLWMQLIKRQPCFEPNCSSQVNQTIVTGWTKSSRIEETKKLKSVFLIPPTITYESVGIIWESSILYVYVSLVLQDLYQQGIIA